MHREESAQEINSKKLKELLLQQQKLGIMPIKLTVSMKKATNDTELGTTTSTRTTIKPLMTEGRIFLCMYIGLAVISPMLLKLYKYQKPNCWNATCNR